MAGTPRVIYGSQSVDKRSSGNQETSSVRMKQSCHYPGAMASMAILHQETVELQTFTPSDMP